jgi:cell division protein ZapA
MEQIAVRILDREYKLAVSPDQRERLLEAVSMVDSRMRAIRDAGRVSGLDRIAVMAALQLAHEVLGAAVPGSSTSTGDVIRRIRRVNEEIDAELKRQEQLF